MSFIDFLLQVATTPHVYAITFLILVLYFLFLYRRRRQTNPSSKDEMWYSIIKLIFVLNCISIMVTFAFFVPRALSTLKLQRIASKDYVYVFQSVFPEAYRCSSTGDTSENCSDRGIARMINIKNLNLKNRPQFFFVRSAVDNRLEWLDPTNGEFRSREVESTFTRNLRKSLESDNPIGFSSFSLADYITNPCSNGYNYSYYCEDGFRHGVVFVEDVTGKTMGAGVWFEGGGDDFGTLTMAPFIFIIQIIGMPFFVSSLITSPQTIIEIFRYIDIYGTVFFIATLVTWVCIIQTILHILRTFSFLKKTH